MIEAYFKELRLLITRYIAENKSQFYIDKLQDFALAHNTRIHSSTGLTPLEAADGSKFPFLFGNNYLEKLFIKLNFLIFS